MKKFIIFLIVILIIISYITYLYLDYRADIKSAQYDNMKYEKYLDKEVNANIVASVINRAVDNNIREEVQKSNNGVYIDNQKSSINVQIKFLDNDKTYDMETLYNDGMDNFIKYYNQIDFKCTKIEYHKNTGRVKYMLFEQITQ